MQSHTGLLCSSLGLATFGQHMVKLRVLHILSVEDFELEAKDASTCNTLCQVTFGRSDLLAGKRIVISLSLLLPSAWPVAKKEANDMSGL